LSQAQSYANHSLYMASIMIDAWRRAETAKEHAAPAIDAAFAPATRLHLLDAYGWQLLACQRAVNLPSDPPHSARALPSLASGIAVSPEVREMANLEQGGWLAELLSPIAPGLSPRRPQNVLAVTREQFDSASAAVIYEKLEALIGRVADAIDES